MSEEFSRPEKLKFPTVYYTFQAKDKNSDELVNYRVQDVPEEYFDKAVALMEHHFLTEETLCVSKKLYESAEKKKDILEVYYGLLMKFKVSLACFREGSDDLVAINLMNFAYKDEKTDPAMVS